MQRQSKIPFIWVDLMTNRRIPSANRTNELGQRYYIHSAGDNQAGQLVAVHRVAAGVKQKRGRVKKVAGSHPGPIERGDIMYYKLTNQDMQTHGGFQWELGKWYEIPKKDQGSSLCSNSYFHCYNHPVLAVIFNPIHAKFDNPRLFEIDGEGDSKEDNGVKFGFTKMKLVKEIELPKIALEQRIEFAIRCTIEICKEEQWLEWANNWLSGKDRSKSANAAANAAAIAAHANANAYAATDAVIAADADAAATAAAYAATAADAAAANAAAAAAAANAAIESRINLIEIIEGIIYRY